MRKQPPAKLYKYQPYTVSSIDNVYRRALWFSKPLRFNDPFDCALDLDLSATSDDDWTYIFEEFKKILPQEGVPPEFFNNRFAGDVYKALSTPILKELFERRKQLTLNHRGVCCLTESGDDFLMWSHYADGHRGFCLEFDTSFNPFDKALEVVYSDTIPTVNAKDLIQTEQLAPGDLANPILKMITTKSIHLAREKEWRIFHEDPDQHFQVDARAMTGLYFGCSTPDDHKNILSNLLANSPTNLHSMQKTNGKFSVSVMPTH